jgi:RNA polymerase sigma-70 factor, ECF subfamily
MLNSLLACPPWWANASGVEIRPLIMKNSTLYNAVSDIAPSLRSFFGRRISQPEEADDLTQETLAKALRAIAAAREVECVRAWVFGIARRTLADYYRCRAIIDTTAESHVMACDAKSDLRAVLTCSARCYLETLPSIYRDPVYLADYEGFSHAEVADKLGLSLSAAKSRIRRGKLMVRRMMEACCRFQYDPLGNVISYELRRDAQRQKK